MVKKSPDFRSLGQIYRELQVHELIRLHRLGGLVTAAGKVTPKQRSACQRSRHVSRAVPRQRKDLALRRMHLQGDDATDLTATGDVLSVQGISFAGSA